MSNLCLVRQTDKFHTVVRFLKNPLCTNIHTTGLKFICAFLGGAARINTVSAVAVCFTSQTLLASMFRILMAPWCSWTAKGNTVLITALAPSLVRPTLNHISFYQHDKISLSLCVFRRNQSCWPCTNAIQKGLSEPVQAHTGAKWRINLLFSLVLDVISVHFFFSLKCQPFFKVW